MTSLRKPFNAPLDPSIPLSFLDAGFEFVSLESDLFNSESVICDVDELVRTVKEKVDDEDKKKKDKEFAKRNGKVETMSDGKRGKLNEPFESNGNSRSSVEELSAKCSTLSLSEMSPETYTKITSRGSVQTPKNVNSGARTRDNPKSVYLGTGKGSFNASPASVNEEQKEHVRFAQIGRKKDYVHIEMINGKATNVLQGLELDTTVFNVEEQKKIVECVYSLQRKGQSGLLQGQKKESP